MEPQNEIGIFQGNEDRYKGITVDSSIEQCDFSIFSQKLDDSLKFWSENGKRAIWFKVHLNNSDWVPVLAQNGFNYHHAREKYVMMYKWLSEEICNIPPYAHTNLGVGAVVLNNNNVLVVQEKYFNIPHWKLPGGYVEIGEDVSDAAIREVKEETGIDTKFHSVLAFRHAHKMMFDNSDIYLIVHLIPTSTSIMQCEREITDCKWMNIDEYLNHQNVHSFNKKVVEKVFDYRKKGIKFTAIKDVYKLLTYEKEFTVFSIEDL